VLRVQCPLRRGVRDPRYPDPAESRGCAVTAGTFSTEMHCIRVSRARRPLRHPSAIVHAGAWGWRPTPQVRAATAVTIACERRHMRVELRCVLLLLLLLLQCFRCCCCWWWWWCCCCCSAFIVVVVVVGMIAVVSHALCRKACR
jgi:hypothetical protein